MSSLASQIKISNMALTGLGADRIINLADQSENARRINAVWDLLRDEVLRSHTWNFATERRSFGLLAAAPEYYFTSAFQIPGDVLRLIESENDEEWAVEGDKVLTNGTSFKAKCIIRVTDVTKWDTVFVAVFSARLEAELAYGITNSRSIQADRWELYSAKIRGCKGYNAQEGSQKVLEADAWINSRSGGESGPLAG